MGIFRFRWLACVFLAAAVSGGFSTRAADEDGPSALSREAAGTFGDQVQPFLGTYCLECHGPTKQKGEHRFDRLDGEIADDEALDVLQDMLDQLDFEMMPPKSAHQPPAAERQQVIAWLTDRIGQYHSAGRVQAARRSCVA